MLVNFKFQVNVILFGIRVDILSYLCSNSNVILRKRVIKIEIKRNLRNSIFSAYSKLMESWSSEKNIRFTMKE